MLTFLSAFFHFALTAANPSWSCELSHREPGVEGTFYLYCSKLSPDGVELVDVGHFVSDKAAKATL